MEIIFLDNKNYKFMKIKMREINPKEKLSEIGTNSCMYFGKNI